MKPEEQMPLEDRICPCSELLPSLAGKTSAVLFPASALQLHLLDKT